MIQRERSQYSQSIYLKKKNNNENLHQEFDNERNDFINGDKVERKYEWPYQINIIQ